MKKLLLLLTAMLATSMGVLAQGNSWQTATLINSGATKTGTLDNTNTEDWYKITVTQEGTVQFIATPSGNLTISTNSNFNGLKNNSLYTRAWFAAQSSGSTTFTCKVTDVGKGTYYVKIARNNGSGTYTLKYTFTPCAQSNDPEPNDDYEHSSVLQSGTTVQGRMGYRTSDDITDIEDWYKIIVPEEGHVEFSVTPTESLTISTNSNFNGLKNNSLYTRAWFAAQSSGSTTMICRATDVGKGTYYVRIYRNYGSGGYTLKYTFTPCALSNDAEPNDDYEQAGWLKSGWTAQGRLGYRTSDDITDSYDWYRIKVTETGPVEIIVTPTESLTISTGSNINVIKNNGLSTVGWFYAQSSGSTTFTYQTNELAEGTYYVRIYRNNGSGGYRLTYNGPTMTGDVDGDNRVTISDVTDLIDHLLGAYDPSFAIGDADVDGDGRITISDVTELIDMLLTAE